MSQKEKAAVEQEEKRLQLSQKSKGGSQAGREKAAVELEEKRRQLSQERKGGS